ncbi:hypothetical protein PHAVU_011G080200 [Phaseolus vulgaris]|uniref:GATA-type domain-containing protein n=1 Tax=Phaseolus vulgaris TaxID=3885 RepID=V7AG75_PHAVU|nr:hypothetical protein PHAVU_011G080200g [Phaseolus vulgaris]ESW04260.1 hypothetical protein PHAVU_011G080200g [Phaseolus vulgaris]
MKDWLFFDKTFNGLSDDILDDVTDMELFDLPLEDVETDDGMEQDWDAQFKFIEEPSLGIFPVQSSQLCARTQNEIVKVETGFSASPAKTAGPGPTYSKNIPIQKVSFKGKDLHQFQTNSPVSVFESSSSSPSVENSNFELPVIPTKRPRSKRRALSNITLLYSIPFICTSPAFQKFRRTAVSKSDLETQPLGKLSSMVKKQRKKNVPLLANKEMKRSSSEESVAVRKCLHCEVTKTPQWREGPMGPKTLCNACGVRYRSGRLFAEYRPAASPTFVGSLHSNSHKKVLEIRNRAPR